MTVPSTESYLLNAPEPMPLYKCVPEKNVATFLRENNISLKHIFINFVHRNCINTINKYVQYE